MPSFIFKYETIFYEKKKRKGCGVTNTLVLNGCKFKFENLMKQFGQIYKKVLKIKGKNQVNLAGHIWISKPKDFFTLK